jgi:hypothetical protein
MDFKVAPSKFANVSWFLVAGPPRVSAATPACLPDDVKLAKLKKALFESLHVKAPHPIQVDMEKPTKRKGSCMSPKFENCRATETSVALAG